jgi:hypothetical protein
MTVERPERERSFSIPQRATSTQVTTRPFRVPPYVRQF